MNFFFRSVREKSGKSQGILRWMISGNPAKDFTSDCVFWLLFLVTVKTLIWLGREMKKQDLLLK